MRLKLDVGRTRFAWVEMRWLVGIFVVLVAFTTIAVAKDDLPPGGWKISTLPGASASGSSCVGIGPFVDNVGLAFVVRKPEMLMMLTGPSLPAADGTYSLSLSIDNDAPISRSVQGGETNLAMPIDRALWDRLVSATKIAIQFGGKAYEFHVTNIGDVIDGVARCGGMPTHADIVTSAPQPIANVAGWTLAHPDAKTPNCVVRIAGPEVDTNIILGNSGQVVLIAGHPGWGVWPALNEVTLQIDDGPLEVVKAKAFNNIVLAPIVDQAMLLRLRSARTLRWRMPDARIFNSDIPGIGIAIDALKSCEAARVKAPPQ